MRKPSSNDQSEVALLHRLDELDAEPVWGSEWARDVDSDLEREAARRLGHFAAIMRRWTDTFMDIEVGIRSTILPEKADELVRCSRLLAEIGRFAPSLVTGPMDRTKQRWTTHALSSWNGEPPSEKRFIAPNDDQPAYVKPFRCGLYTSTASAADASMWRAWLGPSKWTKYQLPWYTWELNINENVRVAEIGSATAWVEFVCTYARIVDGLVYPDWVHIAQDFDAAHFTLPAIAAAQGFHFNTSVGVIPPGFWDVETTFWMRWCIQDARLVEQADSDG